MAFGDSAISLVSKAAHISAVSLNARQTGGHPHPSDILRHSSQGVFFFFFLATGRLSDFKLATVDVLKGIGPVRRRAASSCNAFAIAMFSSFYRHASLEN